jgi:large subunit ribosomal protein L13
VKTYSPRAADIQREWHLIDASGQTLGRLATRIAHLLRGKHKPRYAPHMDMGDYVVVINAAKVVVTGRKAQTKVYYRYSGYPGGLKATTYADLMKRHPERVIEHAVRGMLPKTALGRAMYRKLRVYAGPTHPHAGQIRQAAPATEERA